MGILKIGKKSAHPRAVFLPIPLSLSLSRSHVVGPVTPLTPRRRRAGLNYRNTNE